MLIIEIIQILSNQFVTDFKDVNFQIVTIKYKHCFYSNIVMRNVKISV